MTVHFLQTRSLWDTNNCLYLELWHENAEGNVWRPVKHFPKYIHRHFIKKVHIILTLRLADSNSKLIDGKRKVISLFNTNYSVARSKEDTYISEWATRVIGPSLCSLPGLDIVLWQDLPIIFTFHVSFSVPLTFLII